MQDGGKEQPVCPLFLNVEKQHRAGFAPPAMGGLGTEVRHKATNDPRTELLALQPSHSAALKCHLGIACLFCNHLSLDFDFILDASLYFLNILK